MMYRDLEHPDITMARMTGYPSHRYGKPEYVCEECDSEIAEGDTAYRLGGHIYCEECVRAARFDV